MLQCIPPSTANSEQQAKVTRGRDIRVLLGLQCLGSELACAFAAWHAQETSSRALKAERIHLLAWRELSFPQCERRSAQLELEPRRDNTAKSPTPAVALLLLRVVLIEDGPHRPAPKHLFSLQRNQAQVLDRQSFRGF